MEKEKGYYDVEIEQLKQGSDKEIRLTVSSEIREIIQKSNDGEIGWGDFIGEIRHVLNRMEKACNDNYIE